MTDEALAR